MPHSQVIAAERAESVTVALARCPACLAEWKAAESVRVASVDASDDMLSTGALKELASGMTYARCGNCQSLIAVDSRRDPGVLQAIYSALPDSYWSHLSPQNRFAQVLETRLAERSPCGDLWDIGCGTGTLLTSLSNRWSKHGIEPGSQAVAAAQAQNLDVRQGTAAQCGLRNAADVVLLVDVIEHMPNPLSEIEAIYQMLRPGGTLAVFTGRADALTARLAGSLWYYLHCVGHVTVFSGDALVALLTQSGFARVEALRIEHQGGVPAWKWARRLAGNAARVAIGKRAAPIHFFRDHQLVLASKPL